MNKHKDDDLHPTLVLLLCLLLGWVLHALNRLPNPFSW